MVPDLSKFLMMPSHAAAADLASCAASYASGPQQLLTCLAMLLVDLASPLSRKRRTRCLQPFPMHLKTCERRPSTYSMLGISSKNAYTGDVHPFFSRSAE